MRTLDSILAECRLTDASCIFVSVDVQGFEGYVLDGAHELMKRGALFCIEFWPYGLKHVGGAELLLNIIRKNFTAFYDVRKGIGEKWESVEKIDACFDSYQPDTSLIFTDILLVNTKVANAGGIDSAV